MAQYWGESHSQDPQGLPILQATVTKDKCRGRDADEHVGT